MILVTGGTGFIGAPAALALARSGLPLRLLVHERPAGIPPGAGVTVVRGDLTVPASLRGICTGVHTVVHLAAEVGDDAARCEAVNAGGTRALVAEARLAGVRRMIYLSTAAVYGNSGHGANRANVNGQGGIVEDEVPPAPVSAASRTRLTAERAVLATGGVAIRPMFVYGPGDAWFIPALAGALRRFPVTIDGGRARQSLVAVDDLARAIAALAVDAWRPGELGVLHAAHPEPVTVAELVEAMVSHLGVPPPKGDVPFEQARAFVGDDPRRLRQLELMTRDHVYDGSRLWRRTGVRPVAFARRFAEYAGRYRAAMADLEFAVERERV